MNNAFRALALSAAQLTAMSNTSLAGERCLDLRAEAIQNDINANLTPAKARNLCMPAVKQGMQAFAAIVSFPGTAGMIDIVCKQKEQLDNLPVHPAATANTDRFDALIQMMHTFFTTQKMFCPSDVRRLVTQFNDIGVTLTPDEAQALTAYGQQFFDLTKSGQTLNADDLAPIVAAPQPETAPQPNSWEADTTFTFGPRN